MSKPKIDSKVIYDFVESNPWLTNSDVGQQFGISEAAVRRALEKVGYKRPRLTDTANITIEAPIRYDLFGSGPIAITADYHWPLTRYDLVSQFLDDSEAEGIKALGIAGDLFHQDALSSFDYKQKNADLETEKREATQFLDAAAEVFDTIIISWGNHDARAQKLLRYSVEFVTTMKMLLEGTKQTTKEKIQWTNLDHFWVDTYEWADVGTDTWYICHPKRYSQIPLSQARKIASVKLSNVLTGHSHHHAAGWDQSARFRVGELGGFHDRTRTEYLQRSDPFPHWQNGYAVLWPSENSEYTSTLDMRGAGFRSRG